MATCDDPEYMYDYAFEICHNRGTCTANSFDCIPAYTVITLTVTPIPTPTLTSTLTLTLTPTSTPTPTLNPNPDPDPNQVVSKGNPYKGDSRNLFKYDAILKEARRDSMGSIVPG